MYLMYIFYRTSQKTIVKNKFVEQTSIDWWYGLKYCIHTSLRHWASESGIVDQCQSSKIRTVF